MSHSSVNLTQRSRQHLVNYAQITHLADEENTHAEDRLAAYAQQLAIEIAIKQGKVPPAIEIPEFFVSASPCSTTFDTSSKTTGCTENLINWAQNGLEVKSDDGCVHRVKVTIGRLTVNKLYKSNSYAGASGSMSALHYLKKKGAIGGWAIESDPSHLDLGKIDGYQKVG